MTSAYVFDPIGVVRSPLHERAAAARQPSLARDVAATIELFAGRGYEQALDGLDAWDYLWVLFVFDRNVEEGRGWRAKVLPPRSNVKRGVFSTRSPHRPNPIGLSAVKIDRIDGCVVHVRNVDLLDGTPVLDLKPYVAYADAYPHARAGWLEARDPLAAWEVAIANEAQAQLDWLRDRGVDLREAIGAALALGPQPHPYRRIRRHGPAMRLALKDWRVDFEVEGRRIVVRALATGYRREQLAGNEVSMRSAPSCGRDVSALAIHREFVAHWSRPHDAR